MRFLTGLRSLCVFVVSIFFSQMVLANSPSSHFDLSHWSLKEKVGQLLFIGFRDFKQIEDIKPGGVILYKWNLPDINQSRSLTRRIRRYSRSQLRARPMVAADFEGGMVMRLRRGMSAFPDGAVIGASEDPNLAFKIGQAKGYELAALGINTNLAPVLDIGNAMSFLANRIWGQDPKVVADMTSHYIKGLLSAGIYPVAKHFPGHGSSPVDSHFDLPLQNKKLDQLWREDLKPFQKAIQENVPALMTAHVKIPALDQRPASLSRKIIKELLREKMGYRGLVITDDLHMGGVARSQNMSFEQKALEALKAGTDMIMLAWFPEEQRKLQQYLMTAVRNGDFPEKMLNAKVRRILASKKYHLRDVGNNPYWKGLLQRGSTEKNVQRLSLIHI